MSESFSVKAFLSAVDNGYSSTFDKCAAKTESLGSRIKRAVGLGAAMAVGMKAVSAATSAVTSHLGDAVSRYDQLNNYPKVMSNLGISTKVAEKSAKQLSNGLTGLPTTLDAATSGVTRFTSKNRNLKKSTKYFLALNNAILAGGQPMELQSTALEQLSQAYAKGKPDMIEWKSIQSAMPAQLNQIAKSMGMTADELGAGLRDGSISMDDFMERIVKLNKKGVKGFASFEKQARTSTGGIKTAITNMNTAITRGMADGITAIDKALKNNNMPTIGEMINSAGTKIGNTFKKMSSAIEAANISGIIAGLTPWWNALKTVLGAAGTVISKVTGFMNRHAEGLAKAAPVVLALAGAYRTFKAVSGFIGPVKMFTTAVTKMAEKIVTGKLPAKLFGTAAGEKAVGTASKTSCKSVLSAAAAFVALGGGIALAALGISIIVKSAISLADAGGPAIAVCAGLVLVIAGLAAGAAILGPALTAGSIGMLAFGAAVLMVGAGIGIAAAGLAKLAGTFPIIARYGGSAAVAMLKLGGGLLSFAAGALAAGVSGAVLAGGMAVAAGGCILAAGAFTLAAGGLLLMKAGARAVGSQVKSIGTSAKAAGSSVKMMTSSIKLASSGLDALKSKASSTMDKVISAFKRGKSEAKSTGKAIGQGLANGIASKYNAVYNAAKSLAKAAKKGATITLKVHSPSRVFKDIGANVGEGFALGIDSMKARVASVTENMIATPSMAMAGGGSLGISEDYYRNSSYTIEVPVIIDGREVARTTAPYTEAELNKRTNRTSRTLGNR